MMKIPENKIRPVSVMKEPTDARSFQSVVFNALAVCDLCDEVEIELLAISDLLVGFLERTPLHSERDDAQLSLVTLNKYLFL